MSRCFCWFCGLIALFVFAIAARGQTTQPAATAPAAVTWVDFPGPSGYRVKVPDSMKQMTAAQPGVELILLRPQMDPGGTQAQILIVAPPKLKAGPDLNSAATAYVENFKRAMSDPKVLESTDTKLDGEPAKVYLIQGHQVQGGRETKARLVVAGHNDRLYSIVAMAEPAGFDTLNEVFNKMLESFQWTK